MVLDDPFHEPVVPPRRPSEGRNGSGILRVTSDGDLLSRHDAAGDLGAQSMASPPGYDSGRNSHEGSAPHSGEQSGGLNVPHGARTPRRVQWTQDHVINLAPMEPSRTNESHDSQVSHGNIADVNDALERFRSRRYRPSNLSMASMASSDVTDEHHHHHRDHHTYPPHHSNGEPHNQDEDYDYRLDNDNDSNRENEHHFEENLLDSGVNEHLTNGYIPPGETDGLPTLPVESQQKDDPHATAANLVKTHSSKWGGLRQRVKRGSVKRHATHRRNAGRDEYSRVNRDSESKASVPALTLTTEKSRTSDDGHGGANVETPISPEPDSAAPYINRPLNPPLGSNMPHVPGGTSVLSSLLALYHRHQQMESGGTTPATSVPPSALTTPGGSDEDEGDRRKKRFSWNRRTPGVPPNSTDTSSPGEFGKEKRSRSSTSIADRTREGSPLHSPGLAGNFARAHQNWRQQDRPKAARSDAGVFGALIGSTGGLAASASPGASTLIPAAKRPGFHLNRYSLPDTNSAAQSRHSLHEAGEANGRHSTSSRPGSVYSSTVIADSPTEMQGTSHDNDHAGSKSTDNLIMMKRNKKPSSLNLAGLEKRAEKFLKSPVERVVTGHMTEDDRKRKEWEAEKRRRKKAKDARKKQEVFIIQHVAAILARQQFVLKLARALMMFGSPTHRLETQIQATARVLEINAQVVYLPGTMLVSFGDDATHTSETKFLKQGTGLDLGNLLRVHNVYWNVVHDRVSVDDANKELDTLMTSKPIYSWWQMVIIGMLCSAFIVVPSFYASFLDALMAAAMGGLLILVQIIAAKNDMFSNVFEIVIATLISFIAAVVSYTDKFCYTAVVSGGVVLILPGFIVLTGALELASRNITAGAVRIGYAVIYSLFLGFGISIGGEIYFKIRHQSIKNATDWQCTSVHYEGAPWYMQTPSGYWYYLCVPGYALFLSMRNGQPLLAWEMPVMIAIACAGWVVNHFSQMAFTNRSDIVSAIGSFCVGILGNVYGRLLSNGASFPVMVTGILMQLPSGLGSGGLFSFAAAGSEISESNGTAATTSEQYSQGFQVAEQLVSVAIGLTVGLFVAAVVTHPLGGSRRRGAGIFSF